MTPIGDEAAIAALRASLPAEVVSQLFAAAPDNLKATLEVLEASLDAGNSEGVSRAVHAIKGTAGSLYGVALSQRAAELEAVSGDLDAVRASLDELKELAARTIAWWSEQ